MGKDGDGSLIYSNLSNSTGGEHATTIDGETKKQV